MNLGQVYVRIEERDDMNLIETMWQDFRFASRMLMKQRGFAAAVVVSLALGIGGTSAFFTVLYGVLIDPYVYKDARHILVPTFSELDSDGRRPPLPFAMGDFLEMEKSQTAFESMIYTDTRRVVVNGAALVNANVTEGSSDFFSFFGTPAFLGRTFVRGDIRQPQNPPALAVLGYRFWMKEFHGDRHVIGTEAQLGERDYRIIGVMPPRFTWFDTDVFTPAAMHSDGHRSGLVYLRLKSGGSLQSADAQLQALTERVVKQNPSAYPTTPIRMHATPLQQWLNGKGSGRWTILMSAVCLLLLLSCVNVSILLLARGDGRQREIAMRFALGASTGRVVRQLLTETMLLAAIGCGAGLLLAAVGVPAILALLPETSIPHEAMVQINLPVIVFALAVSMVTGLLIGVTPALRLSRASVHAKAQGGERITSHRSTGIRAQTVLVMAEVGMCSLLLICSIVALQNFRNLYHAKLGYDANDVAVLSLSRPVRRGRSWEERREERERVRRTLSAIRGVQSVSEAMAAIPPAMEADANFLLAGDSKPEAAAIGLVGASYFETLRTPFYLGRSFTETEVHDAAHVVVVNRAFANRLAVRGVSAIGALIRFENLFQSAMLPAIDRSTSFRIVGVSANIENENLAVPTRAAIYLPYTLYLDDPGVLLVRTRGNVHGFQSVLQKSLYGLSGANVPLAEFDTLSHLLSLSSIADARSAATLFTVFGCVALTLAGFGTYSVAAYSVTQRRKEFAIRRALGAQSRQIAAPFLRWLASVVVSGLGMGVLGVLVFGRVLAYYEQGWEPTNAMVLLAVSGLLLVAQFAALCPTVLQALRISPSRALRSQ